MAIEAVGTPQPSSWPTWHGPAAIANIGVHGEPATLHLEAVDQGHDDHHWTGGHLLDADADAARPTGQLDAGRFVTHHFGLDQFEEAYDVFGRAADTGR